jgi:hypothetical protein
MCVVFITGNVRWLTAVPLPAWSQWCVNKARHSWNLLLRGACISAVGLNSDAIILFLQGKANWDL